MANDPNQDDEVIPKDKYYEIYIQFADTLRNKLGITKLRMNLEEFKKHEVVKKLKGHMLKFYYYDKFTMEKRQILRGYEHRKTLLCFNYNGKAVGSYVYEKQLMQYFITPLGFSREDLKEFEGSEEGERLVDIFTSQAYENVPIIIRSIKVLLDLHEPTLIRYYFSELVDSLDERNRNNYQQLPIENIPRELSPTSDSSTKQVRRKTSPKGSKASEKRQAGLSGKKEMVQGYDNQEFHNIEFDSESSQYPSREVNESSLSAGKIDLLLENLRIRDEKSSKSVRSKIKHSEIKNKSPSTASGSELSTGNLEDISKHDRSLNYCPESQASSSSFQSIFDKFYQSFSGNTNPDDQYFARDECGAKTKEFFSHLENLITKNDHQQPNVISKDASKVFLDFLYPYNSGIIRKCSLKAETDINNHVKKQLKNFGRRQDDSEFDKLINKHKKDCFDHFNLMIYYYNRKVKSIFEDIRWKSMSDGRLVSNEFPVDDWILSATKTKDELEAASDLNGVISGSDKNVCKNMLTLISEMNKLLRVFEQLTKGF